VTGEGFAIATLPADFALPYATDPATRREIVTLHLRPARVMVRMG